MFVFFFFKKAIKLWKMTEINSNQFYLLLTIIKGYSNLMYLTTTQSYNLPVIQNKCIWAMMIEKCQKILRTTQPSEIPRFF